jgi:Zn-dependent oligopeptidase
MMMGNGNSSDILDNLSFTSASSSLNSEQRQILETLLNQQSKSGVEISPPVQIPVGKPSEDLVQLVSNFSQSEIESLISFLKGNEQKQ